MELFNCGSVEYRALVAERDALAAQLAALKKRVADAARRIECTPEGGTVMYALVPLDPVGHTTCTPARLEDGE